MEPDTIIINCIDSYIENELKLQKEINENKPIVSLYNGDTFICNILNLKISQTRTDIINTDFHNKIKITGSFNTEKDNHLQYLDSITKLRIDAKDKRNNFSILDVVILEYIPLHLPCYEFTASQIRSNL